MLRNFKEFGEDSPWVVDRLGGTVPYPNAGDQLSTTSLVRLHIDDTKN
jgi:hypothetical protein